MDAIVTKPARLQLSDAVPHPLPRPHHVWFPGSGWAPSPASWTPATWSHLQIQRVTQHAARGHPSADHPRGPLPSPVRPWAGLVVPDQRAPSPHDHPGLRPASGRLHGRARRPGAIMQRQNCTPPARCAGSSGTSPAPASRRRRCRRHGAAVAGGPVLTQAGSERGAADWSGANHDQAVDAWPRREEAGRPGAATQRVDMVGPVRAGGDR